jgi:hypothetical protein
VRAERSNVRAVIARGGVRGSPRVAALCAAALCAAARLADAAECPDGTPRAACVLHDEGVAALTAKRYDEAATKFRGAITAHPSARSHLGYSQALEGQGKLALAYETMLVAQRLSNEEMVGPGAKDPVKIGRAERIKYKLSELGGRVGFVSLRLPEGVSAQRLVSVRREGEGDLASPIGRWVAVAPDQQVLIASLDDGTQVEVIAKVASGSQSNLVLPIPAQRRPGQPGQPAQSSQGQPPGGAASGQDAPIGTLYQKPAGPAPLPTSALAVGMTVLSRGAELPATGTGLGAGIGLFGLFERRVSRSIGVTLRADYVWYPPRDIDPIVAITGAELMMLAGLRTMTRTLHARLETGLSIFGLQVDGPFEELGSRTDVYPVIGLGAGLQLSRVRLHATLQYALITNDDGIAPQLPLRFMGVVGIDLWRR